MRTGSGEASATTNVAASKVKLAQPLHEVDGEARRIAGELAKLNRDGAIKGPADALFFACLIRDFGATYTGPVRRLPTEDSPHPCEPSKHHVQDGEREERTLRSEVESK